jgi:hypothetical protein
MLKKIAKILRKNGNLECIEKANIFDENTSNINSLNLRSLRLELPHVIEIASTLEQDKISANTLKSISFSYNNLIGDHGAAVLAEKLPLTINEIGLVDCGINDSGGIEILNWMEKSTHLRMICIEHNNFSNDVKIKFNLFKKENPHIIVIY